MFSDVLYHYFSLLDDMKHVFCICCPRCIPPQKDCFIVTGRLNGGISQIKQILAAKFTTENHENQEELTKHIEKAVKTATSK
jgi:hypothetical protein